MAMDTESEARWHDMNSVVTDADYLGLQSIDAESGDLTLMAATLETSSPQFLTDCISGISNAQATTSATASSSASASSSVHTSFKKRVTMNDINQIQFDVLKEEKSKIKEEREKLAEERENLALMKEKLQLEITLLKRKFLEE